MPSLFRQRSKKMGLPPGSAVYIGEKRTDEPSISVIHYFNEDFEEKENVSVQEAAAYKDKDGVTWINVDGVHVPELIKEIGDAFSIDKLAIEDILNTDQRPKIDDFTDCLFIVFKMLSYTEKHHALESEQISLIVTDKYLISFQEGNQKDTLELVLKQIRLNAGDIRRRGTDYLTYIILDLVVDNYFAILEKLGDKVEALENEVVANPTPGLLQRIIALKSEMLYLRKAIWPMRELISHLERNNLKFIDESTQKYFRDVYDHAIQVIDVLENFRDVLSGLVDMYLSSVSNKTNDTMKILTIITMFFLPMTVITGIYGMNFQIPEYNWHFGYFYALSLMVLSAIVLFCYFKWKKWW